MSAPSFYWCNLATHGLGSSARKSFSGRKAAQWLASPPLASKSCRSDNVGVWEKACATLGRQLRLAPISQINPKNLGRRLAGTSYGTTPNQEQIARARGGTTGRGWKAKG